MLFLPLMIDTSKQNKNGSVYNYRGGTGPTTKWPVWALAMALMKKEYEEGVGMPIPRDRATNFSGVSEVVRANLW
jgi:hypothetical protein